MFLYTGVPNYGNVKHMKSLFMYNTHPYCYVKQFLCTRMLEFQMVIEVLVNVDCSAACVCKLQNNLHAHTHTHRISQLCEKSITFKGQYLE